MPQNVSGFHRVIRTACTAVLPALVALTSARGQGSPDARRPASLVVVITVDQMRGDYIARYASQYTGGVERIASQAALFPHGMQDHANTETAPGHSTILSGREPTHTGIVSNDRGVPDPLAPLVDYPGAGASPARFIGTTLVDWLHSADANSRVLIPFHARIGVRSSRWDARRDRCIGGPTARSRPADTMPTRSPRG